MEYASPKKGSKVLLAFQVEGWVYDYDLRLAEIRLE